MSDKTKVKTNTKKGSVQIQKIKVVTFKELWSNYPSSEIKHLDPKTSKETFDNHCAINLSHSLLMSGISMSSFKGTKCWNCSIKDGSHIVRAQELADWLKKKPFPGCPDPIVTVGQEFKETLKGKKGIIFFKDYWQREVEKGSTRRTGDHIDFWDDGTLAGSGSVGSFFRISLGFHWDGWMSDHELSKQVLLWELK